MPDSTTISSLPAPVSKPSRVTLQTTEIGNPRQALPSVAQRGLPPPARAATNSLLPSTRSAGQIQPHQNPTMLPSRHVPTSTQHLTRDAAAHPTHVPRPQRLRGPQYPPAHQPNYRPQGTPRKEDRLDAIYSEVQTPLIVALLFFLFQMPYFQKFVAQKVPSLFGKDGNPGTAARLLLASLFGASFYLISRVTNNIS